MHLLYTMHGKFYAESGLNPVCAMCGKDIIGNAIFIIGWSRTSEPSSWWYCNGLCASNHVEKRVHIGALEAKRVSLVHRIPKGAIGLRIDPPELQAANVSTFEAAFLPSESTTNKCRVAGTESWEGAQVGLDMTSELERLDKSASQDDFMLGISAKPYKEPKELQNDDDKRMIE